ncbi:MAG: hypothetical protein IPF88_14185 [Candidatus Microthrix sp.]|nr:hypothetical protein [Candidatus Microthrix sp.]
MADLAERLNELGVLDQWDERLGRNATYRGVDWDSERTQPGNLHVNVHRNAQRALSAVRRAVTDGASAVCWATAPDHLPDDLEVLMRSMGVPLLRVSDERRAFSLSSALLQGFPQSVSDSIGITGTNAKTTTAIMLAACMQRAGIAHALSTSLIAAAGDETFPPGLSTPDAPQIQELLARAVEVGATHAVVEASSQGLSDQRLVDVPFSVGICTTIGSDHLEVHGSDAAYRRAKRLLFDGLGPAGFAVHNADEPDVVEVAAGAGAFDVPVGRSRDALALRDGDRLTLTPALARRCGREPGTINVTTPPSRATTSRRQRWRQPRRLSAGQASKRSSPGWATSVDCPAVCPWWPPGPSSSSTTCSTPTAPARRWSDGCGRFARAPHASSAVWPSEATAGLRPTPSRATCWDEPSCASTSTRCTSPAASMWSARATMHRTPSTTRSSRVWPPGGSGRRRTPSSRPWSQPSFRPHVPET